MDPRRTRQNGYPWCVQYCVLHMEHSYFQHSSSSNITSQKPFQQLIIIYQP